jgi:hypothetical protein
LAAVKVVGFIHEGFLFGGNSLTTCSRVAIISGCSRPWAAKF